MTEPWAYGGHELRVPRGADEPVGKPRRVLIFQDGDAECGCRRQPADRRRARVYPYGTTGCVHVERARRMVTEPLRLAADELIHEWGYATDDVDRREFAAYAVRRLQDARNADDRRRDALDAYHARDTDWSCFG